MCKICKNFRLSFPLGADRQKTLQCSDLPKLTAIGQRGREHNWVNSNKVNEWQQELSINIGTANDTVQILC